MRWMVLVVALFVGMLVGSTLATGHGGPENHPGACLHYQGRPVLLRQCIRRCHHPHDRSPGSIARCVRKFKRKHP